MVSPVSARNPLVVSLQSMHSAVLSTSTWYFFLLDFVFIFDCSKSRSKINRSPRCSFLSFLFFFFFFFFFFFTFSSLIFTSVDFIFIFFLDLEFYYFDRLYRNLDLVFIQLDSFTPFGRMFVFSISYFMMWIFCPQRNAISQPAGILRRTRHIPSCRNVVSIKYMASAVIDVFFIAITNFNTIFFFQNLIHSLRFILKIILIFF